METATAKKHSKLKLVLAGLGAVYLVGAGVWAGQAWWKSRNETRQPSLAAHPERAGEMLLDREVDKLNARLGLTDEQKKQVRGILDKAGVINTAPAQAMQGMTEARRNIREILNPEQLEKMDKTESARAGQFADRMVARLKKEVGITAEQETAVRNLMDDANPLKRGDDSPVPVLQRFAQTRGRVRNLLTPEQQEKFDKMQGPGGGMLRRFMPGGGQHPPEEN